MKKIFIVSLVLITLISAIMLMSLEKFSALQLASAMAGDAKSINGSINWLLVIVGLLLGAILVLIFDISNLSTKITGKKILNWNNINAWLSLAFIIFGMIGVIWEFGAHGKYVITDSASAHGQPIQKMFNTTLLFTGIVFVITQILLFVFTFMYKKKEGRKAVYYSHNNKLEIVWTLIPFVVMAILVLMGYQTWKDIMYKNPNIKPNKIEIFAYQFGWNARYPGSDNQLGEASFNYISSTNPLGLPIEHEIDKLKEELMADILSISDAQKRLPATYVALLEQFESKGATYTTAKLDILNDSIDKIKSGELAYEIKNALFRKKKQLDRIAQVEKSAVEKAKVFNDVSYDDLITNEIHLILNQEVEFLFRARDVIHSAYLPHFKAQMNCVPGMPTKFRFKPITTSEDARAKRGDETFDYYLFCAKVCGSGHYNMRIKIIVETQEQYNTWIKSQNPAFVKGGKKVEPEPLPLNPENNADTTAKIAYNF